MFLKITLEKKRKEKREKERKEKIKKKRKEKRKEKEKRNERKRKKKREKKRNGTWKMYFLCWSTGMFTSCSQILNANVYLFQAKH